MTIIRKSPEEITRSLRIEKDSHQPQHPDQQQAQPEITRYECALFWNRFNGQRLAFHLKAGSMVEGSFISEENGYLHIEDAVVTGSNHRIRTPWIMLETSAIAHFHPAGAEVERFKK